MLRVCICAVAVFFSLQTVCFGQETPRSLYDQAKYQEALDLLQKNGLQSANDFYNAGNCYYRLGKLGQALAYYEKAKVLAPSHEVIAYNLNLVRRTLEKTGALPKNKSFWSGTGAPFLNSLSSEFFYLFIVLGAGSVAFLSYRARQKSVRLSKLTTQPLFLTVLVFWVLSLALAFSATLARQMRYGVIITDVVSARSGPNATFTELFKLPAGTKVEFTGELREGWRQVRFSLGNVGWIMEKELLPL